MVVCVLSKAGVQNPSIPFKEVVGKVAKGAPGHIGATALKVGVVEPTLIVIVVVSPYLRLQHSGEMSVNIFFP